ncbi:AraC family transcriptional regulator [Microbacterium marinilacus]|uniref:Helix-turn-helix transcriptional regulator n=1 Tax=Microbacterium marinilacus TaxID=415209 RepID=A0ABP7BTP1_9MICO|nr:AraC family transcriptional regulator [Microbacterium marinilacus]MBY0689159.1 AraC family transcriptional regulator [Microbacterium marinilacus]
MTPRALVESVTHCHDVPELTWTVAGSLRMRVDGREWTVDAARSLWIPAGVPHVVLPSRDALAIPVFFPGEGATDPGSDSAPRPVLRTAEIDHLARTIAQPGLVTPSTLAAARRRLRALVADPAPADLPMPTDPRAREVAAALVADPGRQETLEEWGRVAHVSAKTLQRCFATETGLRFPEWRTRLRLRAARRLLASDASVHGIAARVGYASPTGFIEAFRREYGETPRRLRDAVGA